MAPTQRSELGTLEIFVLLITVFQNSNRFIQRADNKPTFDNHFSPETDSLLFKKNYLLGLASKMQ
jgi:hypothetical protein